LAAILATNSAADATDSGAGVLTLRDALIRQITDTVQPEFLHRP